MGTWALVHLCACFGWGAGTGGEAGKFLSYGAGGRALAMGGAFYGLADDATAAYWNPAGLAGLERKELVAMYAQLYADTNLGFLAYAHPAAGFGTIGFTYNQLVSDGFEKVMIQTDSLGNIVGLQTLGTFSDEQRAIGVAWGRAVAEKLNFGAGVKFLTRKLDTSAWTSPPSSKGLFPAIRWASACTMFWR
ncbi:MAG: UPF0164 family protein [Elusimicrobia bacterium]|nr:UPF0164 family protein [Elusimicrobiota bacterium]